MKLYTNSLKFLDSTILEKLNEIMKYISEINISRDTSMTNIYLPSYMFISSVEYKYTMDTIQQVLDHLYAQSDIILSRVDTVSEEILNFIKRTQDFIRDYNKSLNIISSYVNSTTTYHIIKFIDTTNIKSGSNIRITDTGTMLDYVKTRLTNIKFYYDHIVEDVCEVIDRKYGYDFICSKKMNSIEVTFDIINNVGININYVKALNLKPLPINLILYDNNGEMANKEALEYKYEKYNFFDNISRRKMDGKLVQHNCITIYDKSDKNQFLYPKYLYSVSLDDIDFSQLLHRKDGSLITTEFAHKDYISSINVKMIADLPDNTNIKLVVKYFNEINNTYVTSETVQNQVDTSVNIDLTNQRVTYTLTQDNVTDYTLDGKKLVFPYPIYDNLEVLYDQDILPIQNYKVAGNMLCLEFENPTYNLFNYSDYILTVSFDTKPYKKFYFEISLSTDDIFVTPILKSIDIEVIPCIFIGRRNYSQAGGVRKLWKAT